MVRAGVFPTTRFARVTCLMVGMDLLLYALKRSFEVAGSTYGQSLNAWVSLLGAVSVVLLSSLLYRWVKARMLWRLRNRLIVTYVFIGVIPAVLLLTIASLSLYFFAGQFANFLVTSQLESRLRTLEVVNSSLSSELATRIEHYETPTAESVDALRRRDPAAAPRQFCAWIDDKPLSSCGAQPPFSEPVAFGDRPASMIVWDQEGLFLRAVLVSNVAGRRLAVVSSEPLDGVMLGKIAAHLGQVSLDIALPGTRTGSQVLTPSPNEARNWQPILSAGVMPTAGGSFDREINFGTPLSVVDWHTGEVSQVGVRVWVQTRPAALYARLFALNDFANQIKVFLVSLVVIFAVIVLLALVVGTRLTQTVTRAIAQLYLGTRHINQGDFSHRIPVKSDDQLATLAHSFNSMSESLQKLLEEQKEKQKLQNELAIAQEVQAQLFPQRIDQLPDLEVYGFCRPARTVSGDYYDFLRVDPSRMLMAVGDVSGKGISAALLMATIHSAVRAYTLEGIPILRESQSASEHERSGATLAVQGVEVSTAALLTLLNQQLYESTPAEKYATMFLGFYDGRERELTYTNAGHLPPIVLGSKGEIRRLDCGGTVVGLFGQADYAESVVRLSDGDIFLAYSDGVTEPENDYGEFGEQRLIELVWENRHLPLEKISEIVTIAVDDWIGANEQPDDVTLVLARAR